MHAPPRRGERSRGKGAIADPPEHRASEPAGEPEVVQGEQGRVEVTSRYEEWESDNGRPGNALYLAVCADLGLVPLKGGRFDQERGMRRQKEIGLAEYKIVAKNVGYTDAIGQAYDAGYKNALEDAKRVKQ